MFRRSDDYYCWGCQRYTAWRTKGCEHCKAERLPVDADNLMRVAEAERQITRLRDWCAREGVPWERQPTP